MTNVNWIEQLTVWGYIVLDFSSKKQTGKQILIGLVSNDKLLLSAKTLLFK
jgi:hypothetical protein